MKTVVGAALGQRYGVSVRTVDPIVRLAPSIRPDYWRRGRTLDRLGIGGIERHRASAIR